MKEFIVGKGEHNDAKEKFGPKIRCSPVTKEYSLDTTVKVFC